MTEQEIERFIARCAQLASSGDADAAFAPLHSRLLELERELTEAREDAARLDWLSGREAELSGKWQGHGKDLWRTGYVLG